jgi:hypothetical protein
VVSVSDVSALGLPVHRYASGHQVRVRAARTDSAAM